MAMPIPIPKERDNADLTKRFKRLLAAAALFTTLWTVFAAPALGAEPCAGYGAANTSVYGEKSVYLIGEPVGVRLRSEGVTVADTAGVITVSGSVCPAKDAGLRGGDTVTAIDGRRVDSTQELTAAVERSGGRPLAFSVTHADGGSETVTVTPVRSIADDRYRVGLWIKDGAAGIGVVSFVVPGSMAFGAVGHALGDGDTPSDDRQCEGTLNGVTLTGIKKGAGGSPGELIGYLNDTKIGKVYRNSPSGVFGKVNTPVRLTFFGGRTYRVASKSEVTEGPARLLIRLPDEKSAKLYSIVIESISRDQHNPTRNMTVRVTDRELSERTGGIVQGMSGSPIIQNGMFAAAVTHVFVNDPTRGYAVFAENMTEQISSSDI